MLKTLTNILKYFTNLSDVKRVIFLMGASIMFLTWWCRFLGKNLNKALCIKY